MSRLRICQFQNPPACAMQVSLWNCASVSRAFSPNRASFSWRLSQNSISKSVTAFSVAASSFVAPRLVGVVGTDFRAEDRALLEEHGVDCSGLEVAEGKTFRWGGRYDQMVVLDADSVLSAETIRDLSARMNADPDLGLIQTMPILVGGETIFARLTQFAGRVYGPMIARGVSAWSGDTGNYWGHNAIIRVAAFAQACGLPRLSGKPPFGGTILSHDFVEAAALCRAGWKVRLDHDLRGSYEGCPPTLLDMAARERRWAP